MNRGKNICKVLKEIRRDVARENDIPLEMPECTYEGGVRTSRLKDTIEVIDERIDEWDE